MIERLHSLVNEKKSFAFETTLSGLSYLPFIKYAKQVNYEIVVFYVWLENAELAKSRVSSRVRKGGHNIPEHIITRRYLKGMKNLPHYISKVDEWYIYDNSGTQYLLVASTVEEVQKIFNFEIFNKILPS